MKKIILLALAILGVCATTQAQTSRSALLHFKDGTTAEYDAADLDSITFTNAVNYDKSFTASVATGVYYGDGQYLIELSDNALDANGLPTVAGQTVVRFIAFSQPASDANNAKLSSGRYTVSSSATPGTIYPGENYLCAIICTSIQNGDVYGVQAPLTEASTANITYNADGTYKIDFKGAVPDSVKEDAGFSNIRVKYEGALNFDNMDEAHPKTIDNDVTLTPDSLSGGYSPIQSSTGSNYGNYTLTFLNCKLDDSGFIVGPGELFNMELFTEYDDSINFEKLAGTYTVTTDDFSAGHWLAGYLYDYYGFMYIPVGTYLTYYGEGGSDTNIKAFCNQGTLTVTEEGDNLHFDGSFTTENGHNITLNYTAPKSSILMRQTGAKQNYVRQHKAGTISPLKPAQNIHNAQNTLKLVKINK